jgi:hypothetical protein
MPEYILGITKANQEVIEGKPKMFVRPLVQEFSDIKIATEACDDARCGITETTMSRAKTKFVRLYENDFKPSKTGHK